MNVTGCHVIALTELRLLTLCLSASDLQKTLIGLLQRMIIKTRNKRHMNKQITIHATQTDLTADWGSLACSANCNLPLNFNAPAPVIRDEKDYVFTQPLMGK